LSSSIADTARRKDSRRARARGSRKPNPSRAPSPIRAERGRVERHAPMIARHPAPPLPATHPPTAARSPQMVLRKPALAAIFTFSLAAGARADSHICEREMARASKAYDVPLSMLYAVGLTETGRRGSLQPYAMNIEGQPFFGTDLAQAVQRFAQARQKGA